MSDIKFKVGDKVRRLDGDEFSNGYYTAHISRIESDVYIGFPQVYLDTGTWLRTEQLELAEEVEDKSKWHKHHDLIIQWAKGAEIEMYSGAPKGWTCTATPTPSWDECIQYRVKPQSDKERIAELEARVEELENKNGG